MQIFQIQEPSSKLPVLSCTKKAIGIDFGTTNSLVAYSINHIPYIIDNELIPTIISDDLVIGEGHIKSIKRLIGKNLEEILASPEISDNVKSALIHDNGVIKLKIGSKIFTIPEAISLVLAFLKDKASKHLGEEVDNAVITVPAHFDDLMRSCIKEAAKLAGLEVLRLISEPTAAAYAYGLENSAEGIYAVYDLGGGTFDLSILKMQMGVFQVLKTDGDVELGGEMISIMQLLNILLNKTLFATKIFYPEKPE
jgi:molecular chaperone HscA